MVGHCVVGHCVVGARCGGYAMVVNVPNPAPRIGSLGSAFTYLTLTYQVLNELEF